MGEGSLGQQTSVFQSLSVESFCQSCSDWPSDFISILPLPLMQVLSVQWVGCSEKPGPPPPPAFSLPLFLLSLSRRWREGGGGFLQRLP